jgi:cation diffusion facilitator family transporter
MNQAQINTVLKHAMNLSFFVGIGMLLLKVSAYYFTGSTAILSDASESIVHIAAVAFASFSLRVSLKPADDDHQFGHAKVAFFSAAFEGTMILVAALYIYWISLDKIINGVQLEQLSFGTWMITLATIISGVLGFYLVRIGKKHDSLILIANGRHILTDSWTSLGVVFALLMVSWTGWVYWDPIIAIIVATNIVFSGTDLVKKSFIGLMDTADKTMKITLKTQLEVLTKLYSISFHDFKLRSVGTTHWVAFHLLFPDEILLVDAHRIATEIEDALMGQNDCTLHILTHLETVSDHDIIHKEPR